MKIYTASDHGGYQYKEKLKKYLNEQGYEVEDIGAHGLNPDDDYPDFVFPLAERVSKDPGSLGIALGRSGNGEAIAANKIKGIRAALCVNGEMAQKAREHNNANILSLGADYVSLKDAKKVVETFLKTPFSNADRHKRRLEKITRYEEK